MEKNVVLLAQEPTKKKKKNQLISELDITVTFPGRYKFIPETKALSQLSQEDSAQWVHLITVDKRSTLKALKEKILELAKDATIEPIVLTELTTKGGKIHVLRNLNDVDVLALADIQLENEAQLLVWNGRDINGVQWDGSGEIISVKVGFPFFKKRVTVLFQVKFYSPEGPKDIFVSIPETSTLQQLKEKLQELTSILPSEQYICKASESS